MEPVVIDINADLGESREALANGADFDLLRLVTSANVACGGHAGDDTTMEQVVAFAKQHKVAVGAHPSYPDRANFGRVKIAMGPSALERSVREQISALAQVASKLGATLVHVKPHGALYHAANQEAEIARAIGRAVLSTNPHLIVVGQAGSPMLNTWKAMGLTCAPEAFADRLYEADGTLRKRTLAGALLHRPEHAAQQAVSIAVRQRVTAADGSELSVEAQTICLHSDTPGAIAIAREVRRQLESAGVRLASLSRLNSRDRR